MWLTTCHPTSSCSTKRESERVDPRSSLSMCVCGLLQWFSNACPMILHWTSSSLSLLSCDPFRIFFHLWFVKMRAYHAKFCHLPSLASFIVVTDCFVSKHKSLGMMAFSIGDLDSSHWLNILNPFLNLSVTFSAGYSVTQVGCNKKSFLLWTMFWMIQFTNLFVKIFKTKVVLFFLFLWVCESRFDLLDKLNSRQVLLICDD